MTHWNFEIVPDGFSDYIDIAKQSPDGKAPTQPSFGFIGLPNGNGEEAGSGKPWETFTRHVEKLNAESPENVAYKIVFVTRHGLGYHNVKEKEVGVQAWKDHWSRQDGDGTTSWVDARLVPEGVQQAQILGEFWTAAVAHDKVPVPQTLYCSPLTRCLDTCKMEFIPLCETTGMPFRPKVRELLRERLWDHTCDRRSKRSYIEKEYPEFEIEESLTENDELWKTDYIETLEEHAARKKKALGEIFDTDQHQIISLTIHSGAIAAIWRACGAADFVVREGSCLAVLIKGTK